MKAATTLLFLCGALSAQVPNPTQNLANRPTDESMPIFRVTVVSRTTKAINYHHRQGTTMVDLHGTALMPEAKGTAKVDSKTGATKIDTTYQKMRDPSNFGPEYLTYVLWGVTPEGRAQNLGEVTLDGDHAKLSSTSELQAFALIVTAEPYFAVTQPSDVVVMENFIRNDTTGTIQQVDAKYELLKRGEYTAHVRGGDPQKALRRDPKLPLQIQEARNAVQIARWTGAEKYAADTFQKALVDLQNAEDYLRGKGKGSKPLETVAREATQMSEDARIITLRKMEEERLANERAAAAEREAAAKAATEAEAQRRAEAEAAKARAEKATAEEARLRAQEQAAASQQLEQQRQALEQQRLAAEKERLAAEQAKQQAEAAAQLAKQQADAAAAQAAKEKAEADAARAAALQQQQQLQAEAERARLAASEADRARQAAENDKEQMRQRLLQQLNVILETRDTARGLIVNMSDVLFDFNKWTLKPGAREKLSKLSGIVLAYPGLRLEVEGHTDSVGSDEYNQTLSEKRAFSVRDYLVQQGVNGNSVTARGLGKADPVASNDSAAGRQRNRRVELVVSGEVIGTQIGPVRTPNSQTLPPR